MRSPDPLIEYAPITLVFGANGEVLPQNFFIRPLCPNNNPNEPYNLDIIDEMLATFMQYRLRAIQGEGINRIADGALTNHMLRMQKYLLERIANREMLGE